MRPGLARARAGAMPQHAGPEAGSWARGGLQAGVLQASAVGWLPGPQALALGRQRRDGEEVGACASRPVAPSKTSHLYPERPAPAPLVLNVADASQQGGYSLARQAGACACAPLHALSQPAHFGQPLLTLMVRVLCEHSHMHNRHVHIGAYAGGAGKCGSHTSCEAAQSHDRAS